MHDLSSVTDGMGPRVMMNPKSTADDSTEISSIMKFSPMIIRE
jgi:hypothetical protein